MRFPCFATVFLTVAATTLAVMGDETDLLERIEVPAGFEVEVAAAPPLVKHPLMACLDDRGRLFIAESAGRNLKAADLEKELPNFVRMLQDTDGDGKFDKSTIFADKMTLPQGALWHDNALYVAAPPHIWRLEDTNDDGVCDKRTILVSKFGYTGNGASVHGCFLGPFGRIYWCEGRHGHEFTDNEGKVISQGKAARIFSCKPDGSDVQVFCGGGMDNPVEIDWTADGEMIGTCNLFYRKRGDCLVHWVRGGVYPRYDQQACMDEFPCTGKPLTEVHNFGHVAVSGMMRYRDAIFGEAYRDNFFVTQFNTHKVVRAVLQRDGSTYAATEHDFLTIHDDDSHPTDVLQDADGSLLVIDTGGWFRIGCPTSQIAKPNILGAIYRVKKIGAKVLDDARGLTLDWQKMSEDDLLRCLDSESFVVREKAVARLAQFKLKDLRPFQPDIDDDRHPLENYLMRVLPRIATPDDTPTYSNYPLSLNAAATWRLPESKLYRLDEAIDSKTSADSPGLQRSAASLVGRARVTDKKDVLRLYTPLLGLLSKSPDRHLEHTVIYSLIERDDPEMTLPFLASEHPAIQRGALIALDQMPSGNLTREDVAPLLKSSDIALRNTAINVMRKRADWGDDILQVLKDLIATGDIDLATADVFIGSIVAFASDAQVQEIVANGFRDEATTSVVRACMLDALGQAQLNPLPAPLVAAIQDASLSDDAHVVRHAVATIQQADPAQYKTQLTRIAVTTRYPADVRIAAYQGLASAHQPFSLKAVRFLTAQVRGNRNPMQRLAAAQVLGNGKLEFGELLYACGAVASAGPLELPALLGMFASDSNERVGTKLVDALARSPGLASLSHGQLTRVLARYPHVRADAEPLLAKVAAQTDPSVLDKLQTTLDAGDVTRGKQVFHSKQASCASCHRIGNAGGVIGPDLSTIGARRNQRDLIEAVVFPSASFARGFETVTIATVGGHVISGMITQETASHITLRTTDQRDVRLSRDEIEAIQPSRVSVMPKGLDKTMTSRQMADLLAYLKSLRP